jgi:hypothetical protein
VELKSMSHRQGSEGEERERQRMAQQAELARLQENKVTVSSDSVSVVV